MSHDIIFILCVFMLCPRVLKIILHVLLCFMVCPMMYILCVLWYVLGFSESVYMCFLCVPGVSQGALIQFTCILCVLWYVLGFSESVYMYFLCVFWCVPGCSESVYMYFLCVPGVSHGALSQFTCIFCVFLVCPRVL